MIANETIFHPSLNDADISNLRLEYKHEKCGVINRIENENRKYVRGNNPTIKEITADL